jgi:HlyD family secretion protein
MELKRSVLLRKYLPGLLLLAGSIALTGWVVNQFRLPGQSNMIESMAMDMNGMKPEAGTVPVGMAKVVLRMVQPELNYTGTLRGFNEISIASRVDGTLSSIPVYAGTQVRRGQLLAQLSAPELGAQTQTALSEQVQTRQELAVIEQETQRLQAEVNSAEANQNEAQAGLLSAQANWNYWLERLPREQALYQAGAIALEELQRYQADAKMAEATVRGAQQRIKVSQSEKKARQAMLGENAARKRAQRASIARAGAGVKERQILQAFTRVTAPVSGVITERLQAPGSVVAAGAPLMTLAQIDPIRVQIQVPEADLAQLKVGTMLTFSSAAHPNDEIEASISSIAPIARSSSRTHLVEAIVPNSEGLLLPGQYVNARLRSSEAESLPQPAIPDRAVLQLEGQDKVWTNRNGRAYLLDITVLARSGDWVWVEGLEKGTEVISDGYQNLTEGLAISPVRWTANGPANLPDAGGSQRLNDRNKWAIETNLSSELLLKVNLTPKPPIAGSNTLRLELLHGGQHPITDAKISLKTSMPAMNMAGPALSMTHKGLGVYQAQLSGMSGLWQVIAQLESGGKRLKPFVFEFNIP